MNYHECMTIVIVLSCIGSNVLAGLLPGGGESGGYQYRPGSGFNDRFGGVGLGRGGDFGGSNFRDRPAGLYGAPAFGGDGNRGGGGDFGGPSSTYGAPGFGTGGNRGYQGGFNGDYGRPQPYNFQYQVYDPPSGNDYSQRESSDGNLVQGEYRVLLPDSRTQIVKYTADDANGYNADVQYEGQAQYPQDGRYGNNAFGNGNAGSNQYLPPRGNYRK
ncbi:pro-resilin-like [Vespula maculifrons]